MKICYVALSKPINTSFKIQDPGVLGKAWFMASSDRKRAEDALYKSNKVRVN